MGLAERFHQKVDTDGPMCEHLGTPCHVWIGGRMPTGYGGFWDGSRVQYAHRISYVMSTPGMESIPAGMQVDHLCHNRPCVRYGHLRLASPVENGQNRSGAQCNSTSGHLGVQWKANRWRARITIEGREIHLGRFTDIEDAIVARKAAESRYHKHVQTREREQQA